MTTPSPQFADSEATLDQAEESLTPAIISAVLAASLLTGGSTDEDYGPGWGVIVSGTLVPAAAVTRAAAIGLRELVRASVINVLIPFMLANLLRFDPANRRLRSPEELRRLALESAETTMDQAVDAMIQLADQLGGPAAADFYRKLEQGGDQQRLEVFAQRASRWIARDALFRAQESLAETLGYTHKRWVTRGDERVRDAHHRLDGKVVPNASVFRVGGHTLRYPGDTTAPIHLWINCRCGLEFLRR